MFWQKSIFVTSGARFPRRHEVLHIYPENWNKYTVFPGNEFIGSKRLVSQ